MKKERKDDVVVCDVDFCGLFFHPQSYPKAGSVARDCPFLGKTKFTYIYQHTNILSHGLHLAATSKRHNAQPILPQSADIPFHRGKRLGLS
jgi:hypothetical protein